MNKETKIFVFIAIGRTGSNYVFNLLDNCLPFVNTYELFHNECMYALNENLHEYMQYVSHKYNDICDDKLVDDIHECPEQLIDFFKDKIDDCKEKEFLTFKIFPEHLKFDKVRKILIRDDVEVFFLKRSPIDSFISELKARISGKWKNYDHTNIKLSLYFNQYTEWYTTKEKWYKDITNLLDENNKSSSTLYYEDFTKFDNNKNLKYILSCVLKNTIFTYDINDIVIKHTMKKQDKITKIEERIENWDQFYSIAKALGWEEKLFSYIDE